MSRCIIRQGIKRPSTLPPNCYHRKPPPFECPKNTCPPTETSLPINHNCCLMECRAFVMIHIERIYPGNKHVYAYYLCSFYEPLQTYNPRPEPEPLRRPTICFASPCPERAGPISHKCPPWPKISLPSSCVEFCIQRLRRRVCRRYRVWTRNDRLPKCCTDPYVYIIYIYYYSMRTWNMKEQCIFVYNVA